MMVKNYLIQPKKYAEFFQSGFFLKVRRDALKKLFSNEYQIYEKELNQKGLCMHRERLWTQDHIYDQKILKAMAKLFSLSI